MAKRITLPRGLPFSSVSSIGDYEATLVDRQYDVTNIKLSQVKNVLGSSLFNLKTLAASYNTKPGLNKWAAFKPNALGNHHGFEINSSDNIVYKPPTDISGYSLGQFAGYHHNAPTPGEFYYTEMVAKATGSFTVMLASIRLPEWDVRDENNFDFGPYEITHLRVRIYRKISGSWEATPTDYVFEITDTNITNRIIPTPDMAITIPSGNDLDVKFRFELGWTYDDGGNEVFEFLCNFPNRLETVHEVEDTIIYEPTPVMILTPFDDSEQEADPEYPLWTYYIKFTHVKLQQKGVNTAEYEFTWQLRRHRSYADDEQFDNGRVSFKFRNPNTEVWHTFLETVEVPLSGTRTQSGDFSTTDMGWSDVTDNVIIQGFDLDLSPPI